jgi:hypothetical protein
MLNDTWKVFWKNPEAFQAWETERVLELRDRFKA